MEDSDHEREARGNNRLPKRYLRDLDDPLTFHSKEEFAIRYRFRKQTVITVLLPLVQVQLAAMDNRGLPILPMLQLLLALRFYATASYQVPVSTLCCNLAIGFIWVNFKIFQYCVVMQF
jgi:hypothetical protein